jgi:hypothetical protein
MAEWITYRKQKACHTARPAKRRRRISTGPSRPGDRRGRNKHMRYNRTEYPHREHNDCSVRALAAAAGVPYTQAYKALAKAGRKKGRGAFLSSWIRQGRLPGFTFEQVLPRPLVFSHAVCGTAIYKQGSLRPTLKQFIRRYPEGTYLVIQSGHAFAVRNSVVIDANRPGPRVRVQQAWKVVAV